MGALDELPVRTFSTQAAWRKWLEANHSKSPGIWLRVAKKGSPRKCVTYQEAVEVALCFGWIDGRMRSVDDRHFVQSFTPRRRKSRWSKINRDKAEALIEAGRMRPAGLRAIEEARADGRWDAAYTSSAEIQVPADLKRALRGKPDAKAFFEGLSKSNRYAVLYQIEEAKKPETRVRRIERFVKMFEEGRKPYE
jgi:uncharacterized protein YdeI (YjbR/CyaY-like superfamily)